MRDELLKVIKKFMEREGDIPLENGISSAIVDIKHICQENGLSFLSILEDAFKLYTEE